MDDDVKTVWLMVACTILNLAFLLCFAWLWEDLALWAIYYEAAFARDAAVTLLIAMAALYLAWYGFASFNTGIYMDDATTYMVVPVFFELIVLLIPLGGLIIFDWIFGNIGLTPTENLIDTFVMMYSFETPWTIAAAILPPMILLFMIAKGTMLPEFIDWNDALKLDIKNYTRNRALTEALAAVAAPGVSSRLLSGFRRNIAVRRIKAGARWRKHRLMNIAIATALFAFALTAAWAAGEGAWRGDFDELIAQNAESGGASSGERSALPEPKVRILIEKDVIDAAAFTDYTDDVPREMFWLLKNNGTLWDGLNNIEVEHTKGMRFQEITSFSVPYYTMATVFAGQLEDGTMFYYPEERIKSNGFELYQGDDVLMLNDDSALRTDGTAVYLWSLGSFGGDRLPKLDFADEIGTVVASFATYYKDDEHHYAVLSPDGSYYASARPSDSWRGQEMAWIGSYNSIPVAVAANGDVIAGTGDNDDKLSPLAPQYDLPVYIYERGGGAASFAIYVREQPDGGVSCFFSPLSARYLLR